MPAAIVIVKQQQKQKQKQKQQEEREKQLKRKQILNINICATLRRCGVDVDAAATRSTSNAADINDVDVAAATTTTTTTRETTTGTSWSGRRQRRSAKAASTLRTVIILMALVFSIMQQQLQQQQQKEKLQQQVVHWPFYNGPLVAAEAAHFEYSNISERQPENFNGDDVPALLSSSSPLPQPETTNHTFKSLAFLASDADSGSSSTSLFSSSAAIISDGFAVAEPAIESDLAHSLPIFDFGMPRNITGRTGHTEAIIKCRVDSLHDKSVSWIRKRDLHILTVGTATYTSDKRFQVTESKDARDWTLHVKSPLAKDSGIYECQVNTEPKMSMAFQLNIIEISPDAKAIISGPHDLHFKAGSAIILNCVVKQPSVKDIGPIYWYRGEHMITPFDADDGEPEPPKKDLKPLQLDQAPGQQDQVLNELLSTELQKDFATRIAMESQLGDTLKSRLRISNAQTTDTGNYTCQPTTASSASVLVHVINDENPAAMQKSTALALFAPGSQQRLGLMFFTVLALQWAKY